MEAEEELAMLLLCASAVLTELEDAVDDASLLAAQQLVESRFQKRVARKLRKRKPLGQHVTPPGERRPAGTGKRQRRNYSYIEHHAEDIDYHYQTGLPAAKFEELLELMRPALGRGRSSTERTAKGITRSWTIHTRLYMTLHWLRHYPTFEQLVTMFGGHKSTVSREVRDTILKMFVTLRRISWPDGQPPAIFGSASGAIDCTSHLRWRVHPWSCTLYRRDVSAHFLSSQLVCALSGRPWDVRIGLGHNNDQGIFNRTNIAQELRDRDITLLGDGGYSDNRVICPDDTPEDAPVGWKRKHAGYRSVVEQDFALLHFWKASGGVFRQDPELQEMVINVIYQLVAFKQEERPLRRV